MDGPDRYLSLVIELLARLRESQRAAVVLSGGARRSTVTERTPGAATEIAAHPVGPTSTVAGATLLHAVFIGVMERLIAGGRSVVNFPSGNIEGADATAIAVEFERYRDRIRHW